MITKCLKKFMANSYETNNINQKKIIIKITKLKNSKKIKKNHKMHNNSMLTKYFKNILLFK